MRSSRVADGVTLPVAWVESREAEVSDQLPLCPLPDSGREGALKCKARRPLTRASISVFQRLANQSGDGGFVGRVDAFQAPHFVKGAIRDQNGVDTVIKR